MAAPTSNHTPKAKAGPSPDVRTPLKTTLESARECGIGDGVYYKATDKVPGTGTYAGGKR